MPAPWPIPYPKPALAPFDFSFDHFFLQVQANIAFSRNLRNQPALVPNGQVLVGQEQSPQQYTPPTIVAIPKGYRYQAARHERDLLVPQLLWSAWLMFEVHFWGPEDPDARTLLYSFSSTAELARQFLVAIQSVNGGPARVAIDGATWKQDVDMNRLGRVLVMDVAIETYVATDPPIQAPFATPTVAGIQIGVQGVLQTASAQSPSSTVTEAVFVVP